MTRLLVPAALAVTVSSTPAPDPPSACPDDMVEIEGASCPWVDQYCLRFVDPRHPENDRCAEFSIGVRCEGVTTPRHFCIDRYEWPNQPGVKPEVAVDWIDARERCAGLGKRLCTEAEWTLACEGPERLPYPYGYARNPAACNIDRPYILPDEPRWQDPRTRPAELARLDQREPSGARDSCVSPYGVYDMTGNVDEWVVNESGRTDDKPYVSGLKGGYWGPVRDRCRPMTTDHNQTYIYYQIGFRCCGEVIAPAAQAPGADVLNRLDRLDRP
ncbi:MAG: SUMF1/EgtB/PvdO family nonheme iron enzyme [Myxococcales bacterium]|nr:SUMF1/EgtB/PvdO family nonheme iron enzyme [Myxococcales bacterium]